MYDTLMVVALVVVSAAFLGSIFVRERRRLIGSVERSRVIGEYKLEINKSGKLDASFILIDGHAVSFVLDPAMAYDLSNALLNAASRLGAKRQGMIEIDPDDAKPNPKLQRAHGGKP